MLSETSAMVMILAGADPTTLTRHMVSKVDPVPFNVYSRKISMNGYIKTKVKKKKFFQKP